MNRERKNLFNPNKNVFLNVRETLKCFDRDMTNFAYSKLVSIKDTSFLLGVNNVG